MSQVGVAISRQFPFEAIGIALSGGGFRATLYHLGVIRALREAGLLTKVKQIASVSGGSILAAHVVLNWERYNGTEEEFDKAASELIGFTQRDVRRRLLRRWILAILTGGRISHKTALTSLLQNEYNKLLRHDGKIATLADLRAPNRPELQILATSLTTGDHCWFSADGFHFKPRGGSESIIRNSGLRLSFGVACSSAFPPLFPPLCVSHEQLQCSVDDFPYAWFVTDGGVFDNLGLSRLADALRQPKPIIDTPIVSNAEGAFHMKMGSTFRFIVGRNVRASDLLMKRVSDLLAELLSDIVQPIAAKISDYVPDSPLQEDGVQHATPNIRTDLDQFSNAEVTALVRHGYDTARQHIKESGQWPPTTQAWETFNKRAKVAFDELKHSAERRIRPWASNDWAAYALLFVVMLYSTIALTVVFGYLQAKRDVAIAQNEADTAKSEATAATQQATDITERSKSSAITNNDELSDLAAAIETARRNPQSPEAQRILQESVNRLNSIQSSNTAATKPITLLRTVPKEVQPANNGVTAPAPAVPTAADVGWLYLGACDESKTAWLPGSPRNIVTISVMELKEGATISLANDATLHQDSAPLMHASAPTTATLRAGSSLRVVARPEWSHRLSGGWFAWIRVQPQ